MTIANAIIGLLIAAKKKAVRQTRKKHKGHTVKQLRDMPYPEYLDTEHWQELRKVALRKAECKCHRCGGNDRELHVHHLTYERRGRERQKDLMVLCVECHEKAHEEMR